MFSKALASSLLFSNTLLLNNHFKKMEVSTLCEDKNEQAAADLDKIFAAASEGGMPPDPEEIQEMLMKAQGKTIRYESSLISKIVSFRKPPQFSRMMLGLKMMTMVEQIDGIKFDFMAPLSPKF